MFERLENLNGWSGILFRKCGLKRGTGGGGGIYDYPEAIVNTCIKDMNFMFECQEQTYSSSVPGERVIYFFATRA